MKKLALLLALVLLLTSFSALADVKIGDTSEEVRYLQWLLIETGWLFSKADGVFGAKTQEAVMNYQRYKGIEPTGVADDWLMEQLDHDRIRLDQEHYGPGYYQAYEGDYVPPFPTGPDVLEDGEPANWCRTMVLSGMLQRDACDEHMPLLERDWSLTQSGDPAGCAEASEMWLSEIRELCAKWIENAPAEDKLYTLSALSAWEAYFGESLAAMYATWNDPAVVEPEMNLMVKNFAGALCEIRYGNLPADPSLAYHAPARENPGGGCLYWSDGIGVDYVTACPEHAALCQREYDWVWNGASDDSYLEELGTDWEQSLLALYDQWLARCDETQAEAVLNVRANFFKALTAQDIALYSGRDAALARLLVVQYEATRLCALLNRA